MRKEIRGQEVEVTLCPPRRVRGWRIKSKRNVASSRGAEWVARGEDVLLDSFSPDSK